MYKIILGLIFTFSLAALFLHFKSNKLDQEPVHIVVALPFRPNMPLDPQSWYTEDYIDYIANLLPKRYHVTGYFVSLESMPQFLDDMHKLHATKKNLRVLNICDGGEWDGYPGLTLCKLWEQHPLNGSIPKSGANYEYILKSDDKIKMQRFLGQAGLKALPEMLISPEDSLDPSQLSAQLKQAGLEHSWPLFCKFNVGAGAAGINNASVCHTIEQLALRLHQLQTEYLKNNIIVQPYLPGPEYTVLVLGDRVYAAVQRKFHNSYNIMYEEYLTDLSNIDNEVSYLPAPSHVQEIAVKAIYAIPGRHHYTRVDLRDDGKGNTYVIDINERPSFGTPSTVKSMLEFNHLTEAQFVLDIVETCASF